MKYLLSATLIFSLLLAPSLVTANTFNPDKLIEDSRFADTETLGGAAGIQKFLEQRGSVLANTSPDFLVKLREPDETLKSRLPDPRPDLGRLRTAAELIFDASTSAGLNPQVILVKLQKEQSLITKNFTSVQDLQRALDRALGFGCPDGGVCGEIFLGFYHQLFGGFDSDNNRFIGAPASLMRSFLFEVGDVRVGRGPMVDASGNAFGSTLKVRTSRKGDTIIMENTQGPPNNAPATQSVTLSNFATAALYRYTPHVYNGNYNFWRFFNEWFRYPNGTLVKLSGSNEIHVIDNSLKRPVSAFVINQRNLNTAGTVTLSPTEFNSLETGAAMPPLDGTLVKNSAGTGYLIEEAKRKLLSSFVAQQRGFDMSQASLLPEVEINSYEDGGRALPKEGTLVKSTDNPAVYMILGGEKRLLTAFVFRQRGLSFANVLTAQPGELDSYPTGSILPPEDGTLVKAQGVPAVYLVANGQLRPLTLFVFQQKNFSFRNVLEASASEVRSWTVGKLLPPDTGVLAKGKGDPTVYYFEAGVRRPVTFDAFRSHGFSFSDVQVAADSEIAAFERGELFPLKEFSLVKTEDSPAVYYFVDGVLRPLTLQAFQNRSFRFEDVLTISAEELARYPTGAVVEN